MFMTKKMKNFKYSIIFFVGIAFGFCIEMFIKFDGWSGFRADWISAITAVVGIPVSVMVLWWQLYKANTDRRYDARTFFDVVQARKIREVKLLLHLEKKSLIREAILNGSIKAKRFIKITNVGNNIAQSVLIQVVFESHNEYFYKSLLKLKEEYTLIPDSSLSSDGTPVEVKIYYLSKLGQQICYSFDMSTSIGNTRIQHSSMLDKIDESKRKSGSISVPNSQE